MYLVSFLLFLCMHLLMMTIDRVRLLHDRSQSTARLVVKDRTDLEPPVVSISSPLRVLSKPPFRTCLIATYAL